MSECSAKLKNMGFEKTDLGTHSCRKGVATMVAAGYTVSPHIELATNMLDDVQVV